MSLLFVILISISFFLILFFTIALEFFLNRYRRVPPLKIMLVFKPGKRKGRDNFICVTSGGKLVLPFHRIRFLPTDVRTLEIDLSSIPVKNPVPDQTLDVKAVTQVKISQDAKIARNAVEHFLERSDEDINKTALEIIERKMREVISQNYIEDINGDRDAVADQVISLAAIELGEKGLEIRSLVIKEVSDDMGYIDALGWARTLEVKVEAGKSLVQLEDGYPFYKGLGSDEERKMEAIRSFLMGRSIEERTKGNGAFHCYAIASALDPENEVYRSEMKRKYNEIESDFINRGFQIEGKDTPDDIIDLSGISPLLKDVVRPPRSRGMSRSRAKAIAYTELAMTLFKEGSFKEGLRRFERASEYEPEENVFVHNLEIVRDYVKKHPPEIEISDPYLDLN